MSTAASQVSLREKLGALPRVAGNLAGTTKVQFKFTQFLEAAAKFFQMYGERLKLPPCAMTIANSAQKLISPFKDWCSLIKWGNTWKRLKCDKKDGPLHKAETIADLVNDFSCAAKTLYLLTSWELKGRFAGCLAICRISSYFAREAFGYAKSCTLYENAEKGISAADEVKNGKKVADDPNIQIDLEELKNLNCIKAIKNILAIAAIAFEAFQSFAGIALLSASATFWLGSIAVAMSLWADFYAETMSEKIQHRPDLVLDEAGTMDRKKPDQAG